LRLDPDVLAEISADGRLDSVAARFDSQALKRRVELVKEVYSL
jgi:hypothetical protein